MKKFYSFLMVLFATLAVSAQNPTLYLRGGITGWSASDDYKFTESNGVYTLTVSELSGEFKIADSSWSSGANFGGASNIEIGQSYTLVDQGSNCTLKESAVANATITFTLATKELVITGAASSKDYELYLLGGLNSWTASDDYKFSTEDHKVYTLDLTSLPVDSEGFQIADETWAVRYNVESWELNYGKFEVSKGVEYNMNVAEYLQYPRLTLDTEAGTLKIEYVASTWNQYSTGGAWAEGEDGEQAIIIEDNYITIEDFLSSGNTFHFTLDYDNGTLTSDIPSSATAGSSRYQLNGQKFWYLYGSDAYSAVYTDDEYDTIALYLTFYPSSTSSYYFSMYYIYLPYKDVDTSVSAISVDDSNAPVEYFNLQGVRVANPENGLYIRRQGNKATKVLVK